jgi:capsular exopolysaccharide synthesis family protein
MAISVGTGPRGGLRSSETAEGVPAALSIGAGTGLDLQLLLAVLKRRNVLISGVIVVITGLAILFVSQLTPLYMAEGMVVVGAQREKVVSMEQMAQSMVPDFYTNETEAAVLESRDLSEKVVKKLNLIANPLFNGDLRPHKISLMSRITGWAREWLAGTPIEPLLDFLPAELPAPGQQYEGMPKEEVERIVFEQVTTAFMSGVTVKPSDRSRVLTVRYTSTDPAMAAIAANAITEIYIADQLQKKTEAQTRAGRWLADRVELLGKQIVINEKAVDDFRRKSGILETGGSVALAQQLTEFNNQLIGSRIRRAEAEAREAQVRNLQRTQGNIETAAAVLENPLIQRLRETEIQLERKIGELKTQFRDQHPKMLLAQAELEDLQAKLKVEIGRISAHLSNEVQLAKTREFNLQQEVDRLRQRLIEQNEIEGQLRGLESELRANKQLYETYVQRLQASRVQDDSIQSADARIISRAIPPDGPFYPRTRLIVLAALVSATMIGIALAFVVEHLDGGFRSVNQLETVTGVGALGLVPAINNLLKPGIYPHHLVVNRPNSLFAEAVRTVRTAIMLSNLDRPPKTVLFTSTMSGEGKTSTALAIGVMAARSGQRSLVIDCDLRHPSLHTQLGQPNGTGLCDYLTGNAHLDDVIEIDPNSGVHYITPGSRPPNASDVLGSDRMKELLEHLRETYDMIILDTPPVLAVADALVLVRMVDKTVYVVRWEKTRRDTAISGLKMVAEAGANLAGIVLTQVDARRQSMYEYYDTGYHQHPGDNKPLAA